MITEKDKEAIGRRATKDLTEELTRQDTMRGVVYKKVYGARNPVTPDNTVRFNMNKTFDYFK